MRAYSAASSFILSSLACSASTRLRFFSAFSAFFFRLGIPYFTLGFGALLKTIEIQLDSF
jgi:hypothetical protein